MEDISRLRDSKYLDYVRKRGCVICGGEAQAHHLQRAQPRAMGRKTGDQYTVPLCPAHHFELHDLGDETLFWALQGIDVMEYSEALFREYNDAD